MELEELKQKWNKFDEQLSNNEVYNHRMLQLLPSPYSCHRANLLSCLHSHCHLDQVLRLG